MPFTCTCTCSGNSVVGNTSIACFVTTTVVCFCTSFLYLIGFCLLVCAWWNTIQYWFISYARCLEAISSEFPSVHTYVCVCVCVLTPEMQYVCFCSCMQKAYLMALAGMDCYFKFWCHVLWGMLPHGRNNSPTKFKSSQVNNFCLAATKNWIESILCVRTYVCARD